MAAGCTIEKFTRMHPPTFTGGSNPIIVENWVQKTEKILKVPHCTDEQKVLYATFQLVGEAERWWTAMSLLEDKRADPSGMTWSLFKEVFFKRYFPASTRDAKANELSSLTQGTLMVHNYAAKYIELSRFAPYLISNEYEKTWRFEKGLRRDIHKLVLMLQIWEFPIIVDKVVVINASLQKDEVVLEQKKRPVPPGSHTSSNQGQWKKKNYNMGNMSQDCPVLMNDTPTPNQNRGNNQAP
ncbi:uncharacterized protein LOC131163583 [Malania oleifera]|uniref:uncharacterized protein LOC131163583 n=1 Tax=Malania oleifera TaxID=397392 RepID=UPI0025AE8E46|nr:uncharacterized protein LOC131163583 [Malania oleifera]